MAQSPPKPVPRIILFLYADVDAHFRRARAA